MQSKPLARHSELPQMGQANLSGCNMTQDILFKKSPKALSQNNFSKLTLLLYSPMLECLVLCTRMHGILGRGQERR